MARQRLLLPSFWVSVSPIPPRTDLHRRPAQLHQHRWLSEQYRASSTERGLFYKRQRRQRARASTHRALPPVLAAALAVPRSQRSLIPRVRPPTHPRGRWPSSWPNPGVRLVSTPLLPLFYRFDTMPSSSSSFRTSLLVYHLLPLSPNICLHVLLLALF